MPDVLVTSAHLRSIPYFTARSGLCVRGTQAWFARHGLDFRAFMRDGLLASVFEATGDGMGLELARWAREGSAT